MQHINSSNAVAVAYQEAAFPLVPLLSAVTVAAPTPGYHSLVTGALQSATPIIPADPVHNLPANSVVMIAGGDSPLNGAYAGMAMRITGGTGAGARGTIAAYNGATRQATVNWGTGASGSAGVPAALDATSQFEISIDCYNRGKVVVKTEYSNAACTASLSVALRDSNGLVLDTATMAPANLGYNNLGTVGYRARGFEVPTDGMDTAFLQVDVAAAGGTSPAVTAWATAV